MDTIDIILSNDIDYIDVGRDSNTISFISTNRLDRIISEGLDPWTKLRSESRIGKFFTNHFFLEEKEVENIVSRYKTFYNFFVRNGEDVFEIVEGEDIAYWYDSKRYKQGGGSLNSSCMKNQTADRFKLYTENPDNVKLLILKEGDLLIGRCLMWTDNKKNVYLDRPYTRYDEDAYLFTLYAEKKGYDCYLKPIKNRDFRITLKKGTERNAPYLDSMNLFIKYK